MCLSSYLQQVFPIQFREFTLYICRYKYEKKKDLSLFFRLQNPVLHRFLYYLISAILNKYIGRHCGKMWLKCYAMLKRKLGKESHILVTVYILNKTDQLQTVNA